MTFQLNDLSPRARTFGVVFLISAVSFGVYFNSLWGDFVYDDSYHLVNLILHCIVSVQVWYLARYSLRLSFSTSIFTSLFFAVHPIHTEAVSGIVGRADVLAAVFFLAAFILYLQGMKGEPYIEWYPKADSHSERLGKKHRFGRLLLIVLLSYAALLSKEQGLMVLPICIACEILIKGQLKDLLNFNLFFTKANPLLRKKAGVLLGGFFGGLLFRLWVIGFKAPDFSPSDNPAANSDSIFIRTATFLYLPVFNFQLLVLPTTLSFDWSMNSIPLVESLADRRVISILIFYSSLIWSSCTIMLNILRNRTGTVEARVSKTLDSARVRRRTPPPGQPSSSISFAPRTEKSRTPSPKLDFNANSLPSLSWNSADNEVNQSTLNNNSGLCRNRNGKNEVCNHTDHVVGLTPAGNLIKKDRPGNGYKLKFTGKNLNLHNAGSSIDGQLQHSDSPRNYKMSDAVLISLLLTVIPFLPATNLFTYVGFVVAERILYIPSIGYCILVGIGFEKIFLFAKNFDRVEHVRQFIRTVFISILLLFSCRSMIRNKDWKSEEALYRSGLSVNPAKAFSNLGNILSRLKDVRGAELAYMEALKYRPNMADTHYNLGTIFQGQGKLTAAREAYITAIRFREKLAVAHLNLGLTLWSLGDVGSASERFQICARISEEGLKDPKAHTEARISCLYNLGRLFSEQRKFEEAISAYHRAIDMLIPSYSSPHSIYNMLGEAHAKLLQYESAEKWYMRALEIKPNHIPAHLTFGHLRLKQRRFDESLQWFKKAVALSPRDAATHQHLGQFYHQTSQIVKAEEAYEEAHALDGKNFDVVFALATLYRQQQKDDKAENFYRRAVELRPDSANAHLNYGAILHLKKDYFAAQNEYMTTLKLNPSDEMARENLRKLERILAQK